MITGLRRFVGFALAPNERGFCGPQEHEQLVSYLHGGAAADTPVVRRLARGFTGPLPYLRLIADAAGLEDPFNPAVVEAYWVGNDLLDAVDPDACARALLDAFAGQPTVDPRRIQATRAAAVPHHAYHVLVTYPWIDLVAAGRVSAVQPLASCLVRVGTVRAVGEGVVEVEAASLGVSPEGDRLQATAPAVVRARPVPGSPAQDLGVGDAVALHYDHLVTPLAPAGAAQLQRRTTDVIDLVNRTLLAL